MLYALRFEAYSNDINSIINELKQKNVSNQRINTIKLLLNYAGVKRRQHDIFGNRSAMEMTKRFIKG